mgnify:CR=1 FL=1
MPTTNAIATVDLDIIHETGKPPILRTPAFDGLDAATAWVGEQREAIRAELNRSGCLMVRGVPVRDDRGGNATPEERGVITAVIVMMTVVTAGAITAATANFSGTLTGFPAGTALTAAHIHTGAAGSNGGPVVNLALTPGEITLATGGGTITKNGITVSVADANAMIANPAGFYFNAHTAANPGGAVRGQLARYPP